MSGYLFRAVWPIVDCSVGFSQLVDEATSDLPLLLATAHADAVGLGSFKVAPSSKVPGSGMATADVLVYEVPAERLPDRVYTERLARCRT